MPRCNNHHHHYHIRLVPSDEGTTTSAMHAVEHAWTPSSSSSWRHHCDSSSSCRLVSMLGQDCHGPQEGGGCGARNDATQDQGIRLRRGMACACEGYCCDCCDGNLGRTHTPMHFDAPMHRCICICTRPRADDAVHYGSGVCVWVGLRVPCVRVVRRPPQERHVCGGGARSRGVGRETTN